MPQQLIDVEELSRRYSLRISTVRHYCSSGIIPHIKVGRRVFFNPTEVDAWLATFARPAVHTPREFSQKQIAKYSKRGLAHAHS